MGNISVITYIIGIVGQIFIFKYLFIKTVRLKSNQLKTVYDLSVNGKGFKFVVNETILDKENELPLEFSGFFKPRKAPPFYFTFTERLLTAGFQSKESVGVITYFRWYDKKIKEIIKSDEQIDTEHINIYISVGSNENYLGKLNVKSNKKQLRSFVKPIEDDIIRMMNGEIDKSSAILYGPPGNSKTTCIRELAKKYGYDIKFVSFNKDLKNIDILQGMSYTRDKTFVVFEDFDSVFDKRDVLHYENPSFTFDAILNSIDGIYNNYKNVMFFMTANDISKIDDSIKNRPSRMKHKIFVSNPNVQEINDILNDVSLSKKCVGMNVDEVYLVKETYLNMGAKYVNDNIETLVNRNLDVCQ